MLRFLREGENNERQKIQKNQIWNMARTIEGQKQPVMAKIIAVTENGCIFEAMDGFAVNIGDCNAKPGQYVDALVD